MQQDASAVSELERWEAFLRRGPAEHADEPMTASEIFEYAEYLSRVDRRGWARTMHNVRMKTIDERIQEYADRKGLEWKAAHDYLVEFALDVIDARRKGGTKVGNRPQQEKHLERARKIRQK